MNKQVYEAPSAVVLKVNSERIICQSGVRSSRNAYGTANELDWD